MRRTAAGAGGQQGQEGEVGATQPTCIRLCRCSNTTHHSRDSVHRRRRAPSAGGGCQQGPAGPTNSRVAHPTERSPSGVNLLGCQSSRPPRLPDDDEMSGRHCLQKVENPTEPPCAFVPRPRLIGFDMGLGYIWVLCVPAVLGLVRVTHTIHSPGRPYTVAC